MGFYDNFILNKATAESTIKSLDAFLRSTYPDSVATAMGEIKLMTAVHAKQLSLTPEPPRELTDTTLPLSKPPAQSSKTLAEMAYRLIAPLEGFRGYPYNDNGQLDIGHGHKILAGENFTYPISVETAKALFMKDWNRFYSDVLGKINIPLPDKCWAALGSFSYTIGTLPDRAYNRTHNGDDRDTITELVNARKWADLKDRWLAYNDRGKTLSRREKEWAFFRDGLREAGVPILF